MKLTHRRKLQACIHPETYQYFLPDTQVESIWTEIEHCYGDIQRNSFNAMWVESRTLLLKAPLSGSPLTALRKRHCSTTDIKHLHLLLKFAD